MRVLAQSPVFISNAESAEVEEAFDLESAAPGFSGEDQGIPNDFPDITTPPAERKGFALMRFNRSESVEVEGHGDLNNARALLAPLGLEPVPTPSGHARISIGSMHYRFFAGAFKPAEVWLAVVARPIGGGPAGHAYLHTVTDSRVMKKIGESWGIPYEKADIVITPTSMGINAHAKLERCATSRLPERSFHQALDFPAYSPTGKTMEVHIEGDATTRAFDPSVDTLKFGAGTAMAKLQAQLGFEPKRWVSHEGASGAIRAR